MLLNEDTLSDNLVETHESFFNFPSLCAPRTTLPLATDPLLTNNNRELENSASSFFIEGMDTSDALAKSHLGGAVLLAKGLCVPKPLNSSSEISSSEGFVPLPKVSSPEILNNFSSFSNSLHDNEIYPVGSRGQPDFNNDSFII